MPKKYKKYKELQTRLDLKDIDRPQLCKTLGRSTSYVDQRFAGHKAFTLREMYIICDLTEIPLNEMYVYFPPEMVGVHMKSKI